MARQRSHSIAFKRQVAQEFIAGESLYALSKRHDISRQLILVWSRRWSFALYRGQRRRGRQQADQNGDYSSRDVREFILG